MKISLLSIGNEILTGKILNTNITWLSSELAKMGCEIENHITTEDKEDSIISGLNFALVNNPNYLIITGGLGPTNDDITRDVLFKYFEIESKFDIEYWDELVKRYNGSGLVIADINKNQAIRPKTGEVIPNPKGTARGIKFKYNDTIIISLPGVPYEMKFMINKYLKPDIKKNIKTNIYNRTLRTISMPESYIQDIIKRIMVNTKVIQIGYYPSLYGVDVRFTGKDKLIIDKLVDSVYENIGNNIYAEGQINLEQVIIDLAIEKKITIAIAESCTGGLIGNRITNVSNSSKAFMGGFMVYSNKSKVDILGVENKCLEQYGAVSKEVAIQMAKNVRKQFNSTYGLSVTGIAGPGGGSTEKPVGLVYIGLSDTNTTFVRKFNFTKYREHNKIKASQASLNFLRETIINE